MSDIELSNRDQGNSVSSALNTKTMALRTATLHAVNCKNAKNSGIKRWNSW